MILRAPFLVLLLYLLSVASGWSQTAPPVAEDWPLIRGDAAMTGVSPTKLTFPLELAWTAEVGNKSRKEGVVATPVVRNGKLYVGAQSGKFSCLELTTGTNVWEIEKKGFFEGSAGFVRAPSKNNRTKGPPRSFEGSAGFAGDLVITGCGDGFVYAWKSDTGAEEWKFETNGEIHAGVNLWTSPEGKEYVLIGSYDNNVYCLDATNGQKVWSFETANYINGAVAIFNNQVVFGGCDGTLYVLNCADGKEIKKIDVGSYIGNNIAAANGVAYTAHYGNKVQAFSFGDGAKLWEYSDRDFPYYAAPAINAQYIVVGSRDKRVRCLSLDKGEEKWQFATRGDVDSSPLICADTHVLFGSNDGFFYALNLADGQEAWRYEIGAAVKSAPAIAGQFILIGADDGNVFCFKNGPSPAAK